MDCLELLVSYGASESPDRLLERSTMPEAWLGRPEPAPCGSVEARWRPAAQVRFPWEAPADYKASSLVEHVIVSLNGCVIAF